MNIPKKNWLEWSVFAVGLLLVVGVLSFLIYDATTAGDRAPIVAVRLGDPEQRPEHFVVPVEITNTGDQTAENVLVEVVLGAGPEQQQSQLEIAFLPRGATRAGWASFRGRPGGELNARVMGFQKP